MSKVLEQAATPTQALPARLRDRLLGRDPLAQDVRSWYAGALGELEVGAVLDGLGLDWHVLHVGPVGTREADVDHVMIGPPGVMVVNTKHHAGAGVWVGPRRY